MLLSISSDSKTVKGQKFGYLTGVLYLAPAEISGFNVCPRASAGCKSSCLYSAGRGAFSNVQRARVAKTIQYMTERDAFISELARDIKRLILKAGKMGLIPAVRLNGTSDILSGEYIRLMWMFPDVQFYDYTKVSNRFYKTLPANYHMTFSKSEDNTDYALDLLDQGHNVAVVFQPDKNGNLPKSWHGYSIIDGDISDLRFLDPKNVVVGLRAKGQAKKDSSGFVVRSDEQSLVW